MTNPYAPPCAGIGPCTEKYIATGGFCECKIASERLQDLTQRVKELEQVNANLRAAFRVNMLRAYPTLSHAEIDAAMAELVVK